MGLYASRYMEYEDSAHGAAINYIRECLRPMNPDEVHWTISYSRSEEISGLWDMKLDTLHKIIGIIQSIAFNQKAKESRGRHGRDRFVPAICAGKYRSKSQRKAAVDSVYYFLYLTKDSSKVDVGILHDMLRGLPCNKKNFVNCSLPVRSAQVEALLKFMISSIQSDYRDAYTSHPRGISVTHDGAIIINSEQLVDLLWRRPEDADRIIEMFVEEGADVGVLEPRLDTHDALDVGVL